MINSLTSGANPRDEVSKKEGRQEQKNSNPITSQIFFVLVRVNNVK